MEPTDEALLLRMMGGEEEAFTLLYRRKHPAIYRFALHMSGNAAVAEDVTQETFLVLIRDARRFDAVRGTLGGFLFGIARNHLRKRWEQDRRWTPMNSDLDAMAPAPHGNGNGLSVQNDPAATNEATQRLREAIATLPENYREAVALCELEEMSYDEAAAVLGCPVGTVRSRLHRARALLAEKLRGAGAERQPSAVGKMRRQGALK